MRLVFSLPLQNESVGICRFGLKWKSTEWKFQFRINSISPISVGTSNINKPNRESVGGICKCEQCERSAHKTFRKDEKRKQQINKNGRKINAKQRRHSTQHLRRHINMQIDALRMNIVGHMECSGHFLTLLRVPFFNSVVLCWWRAVSSLCSYALWSH